jgi:hypothetical protein
MIPGSAAAGSFQAVRIAVQVRKNVGSLDRFVPRADIRGHNDRAGSTRIRRSGNDGAAQVEAATAAAISEVLAKTPLLT